jgi:hypothetical protein
MESGADQMCMLSYCTACSQGILSRAPPYNKDIFFRLERSVSSGVRLAIPYITCVKGYWDQKTWL